MNIRYVGGLLSAYSLTGDYLFVDKAKELTDILLLSFENEFPCNYFSFDDNAYVSKLAC